MSDVVERLTSPQPVSQFNAAGVIEKYDATPSPLDIEAANEIRQLRQRVKEWEGWYNDLVGDFVGVTTDRNDPDRLHDWDWIDSYRPAPLPLSFNSAQ